MRPQFEPFRVSVPATTANLGAGFDAIGIALDLRMEAEVHPSSRFALHFEDGPERPTHDGLEARIRDGLRALGRSLPRASVRVRNGIPLGKGLGSSAAAIVLGITIARRCAGVPVTRGNLARLASSLEGHPDNVLPALFGGIVVCASREGQGPAYLRFRADGALRAVVTVPQIDLGTSQARAILPQRYERGDVVFNTQRAALLAAALASGNRRVLREAMRDRLHQPYRAGLMPGVDAALALHGGAILGIALSGAGPSVLTLLHARTRWQIPARRVQACFEREGVGAASHYLRISARGTVVRPAACVDRRPAT